MATPVSSVGPKGDAFWRTLDAEVKPALKQSDDAALMKGLIELRERFHAHQDAVVELVQLANAQLSDRENAAKVDSGQLEPLSAGLGITSILAFLIGVWLLRRRAIQPLGRMVSSCICAPTAWRRWSQTSATGP